MNAFEQRISELGDGLCGIDLATFQVNVGLLCNQQCRHCHLNCSPQRTEVMAWSVMADVLTAAALVRPGVVDITGGAPEMNPNFRRFVIALRLAGRTVQVRTNLTVLLTDGQADTPAFCRDHDVRLVASMPCYLAENVDAQRGDGVYAGSIEAIRRLNAVGYGGEGGPQLDLVYNPVGPFLPPAPADLETDYRRELRERFGVAFTRLLTITNMPIGRFADELRRQRAEREYIDLLTGTYNPRAVPGLMCRHQISIGFDGTLYDCDFNLALGLPVDHGAPDHLSRFDPEALTTRRIVTGEHCFGCTAGRGSSCAGTLV